MEISAIKNENVIYQRHEYNTILLLSVYTQHTKEERLKALQDQAVLVETYKTNENQSALFMSETEYSMKVT